MYREGKKISKGLLMSQLPGRATGAQVPSEEVHRTLLEPFCPH